MFKLNGNIINLGEFPDGTPSLKIKAEGTVATIEWLYEKNEEILLYYIANHLRAYGRVKELHLVMPYIPNARLDRKDDAFCVMDLLKMLAEADDTGYVYQSNYNRIGLKTKEEVNYFKRD